jgi:hypothetical protein
MLLVNLGSRSGLGGMGRQQLWLAELTKTRVAGILRAGRAESDQMSGKSHWRQRSLDSLSLFRQRLEVHHGFGQDEK